MRGLLTGPARDCVVYWRCENYWFARQTFLDAWQSFVRSSEQDRPDQAGIPLRLGLSLKSARTMMTAVKMRTLRQKRHYLYYI